MIINSVETQKKDKKFLPAIPFRLASPGHRNPGGTLRLFSLFYIYGQAEGYVLLGSAGEYDIGRDPDSPRRGARLDAGQAHQGLEYTGSGGVGRALDQLGPWSPPNGPWFRRRELPATLKRDRDAFSLGSSLQPPPMPTRP